jgi:rare lipoprotein A
MTRTGSCELSSTKIPPVGERDTRNLYLLSGLVLAVVLYANLPGHALACANWNGQTGVASWYGPGLQGNRTADGDTFDMWALTAAHSCMPLGTRIRVTVLRTGRSLIVTVNDRLPSRRRILDLSVGAARALGIAGGGLAVVQLSPS